VLKCCREEKKQKKERQEKVRFQSIENMQKYFFLYKTKQKPQGIRIFQENKQIL
jgi:hypothetical protein